MNRLRIGAYVAIAVLTVPIASGCAGGAPSETLGATSGSGIVFDPSADLLPQMKDAIDADDLVLVGQILEAGFDPLTDFGGGANALHRAASGDHTDVIPLLVAAGVSLDDRAGGMTPLHNAAIAASGATVMTLLEAGADPTSPYAPLYGATALHLAAYHGNVPAIDALLAWGVDINIVEITNGTPLIYAAINGETEAVQHLVDLGADLNVRDTSGLTALGWTDAAAFPEVYTILVAAGASL